MATSVKAALIGVAAFLLAGCAGGVGAGIGIGIPVGIPGVSIGVGVGTGAAIIVIATGVVCPELTVTVVE